VRGPVDFAALRRFASFCLSVAIRITRDGGGAAGSAGCGARRLENMERDTYVYHSLRLLSSRLAAMNGHPPASPMELRRCLCSGSSGSIDQKSNSQIDINNRKQARFADRLRCVLFHINNELAQSAAKIPERST
jgi:hypothetical protein